MMLCTGLARRLTSNVWQHADDASMRAAASSLSTAVRLKSKQSLMKQTVSKWPHAIQLEREIARNAGSKLIGTHLRTL